MAKVSVGEIADIIVATQATSLVAIALAEALLVHAGQTSGTPDTFFCDVFEIASARLDKFREGQVAGAARSTLSSLPLLYANRHRDV
jgi:hypothetical protein